MSEQEITRADKEKMPNSWTVLKDHFTKNKERGSFGYFRGVLIALEAFGHLGKDYLVDWDVAFAAMNADFDVARVILNAEQINRLEIR